MNEAKNQIFVIKPFRWNGTWVFDDPAVGLVREPFVGGVPEIIDRVVCEIPNAEKGFLATFSASPFPGADLMLERTRPEWQGTWYRWAETGQGGWLCPALFLYFKQAPERLYVQVKPAPAEAS